MNEGIDPQKVYYHGIGYLRLTENGELECLKILRAILSCKHIYSRKLQKQFLGDDYVPRSYNENLNGMDYISICKKIEKYEVETAYALYVKGAISFVLNGDLEEKVTFRKIPYEKMVGEYQVKDKIAIDNVVALALPFKRYKSDDFLTCSSDKIREILIKDYYMLNLVKQELSANKIEFPIVDSAGTLIPSYEEEYERLRPHVKRIS